MKFFFTFYLALFSFFLALPSVAEEKQPAPIIEETLSVSPQEEKNLTPLEWLQAMQKAHKKNNYGLYFIHHSPNGLESFRYYHTFFEGKNYAQLTHLEGLQHEIVLKEKQLIYFTPHEPTYALAVDHMVDKLPILLNADLTELKKYYEILPMGLNRIANRLTKTFRFVPKDPFRYQLLLFVDAKEHWLLRQDVLDKSGNLLEQFRALHVVPLFAPENFVKSLEPFDASLLTQLNSNDQQSERKKDEASWQPSWLPKGFQLVEQRQRQEGEQMIESQFYSDGLFSFTLNLAPSIIQNAPEKSWTNGTMTLFSQSRENKDITLVGEIPLSTAKRIVAEVVIKK